MVIANGMIQSLCRWSVVAEDTQGMGPGRVAGELFILGRGYNHR